jgi:3-hydroxyisobutyrate dehydrogenase
VGFVGLGRMGQGMAQNLLRSGADLLVFDTNPDAAKPLVDGGAECAADMRALVRRSDVIFTSLPGPAQVEEVVAGPGGVVEHARPGLALFDLSTNSVSLVRRLHDELKAGGASMLDAPVSGGPAGAAARELAIWVGGDRRVFDRHLDLLNTIGNAPRYVGSIGAGTVTKLSHNLLGAMIMLSLAETFSLAVKAGMDPLELWEAMRLGLVGRRSPLDMLNNQVLPGKYEPPAFALELAHKDVSLATSLGRELGVPMRLANLTLEEMTEALGRGLGHQDSRAFLKVQLERAGVELAVDPDRLLRAIEALEK